MEMLDWLVMQEQFGLLNLHELILESMTTLQPTYVAQT